MNGLNFRLKIFVDDNGRENFKFITDARQRWKLYYENFICENLFSSRIGKNHELLIYILENFRLYGSPKASEGVNGSVLKLLRAFIPSVHHYEFYGKFKKTC